MGSFRTLLAAAIFRGLVAKGFGLQFEGWLEARFPALPHLACAALGIVVAVAAVELAALWLDAVVRKLARL